MKEFYIDLGSSTIKVYEYEDELKLVEEKSIYFKNDFSKETGISEKNKKALYSYFTKLFKKYSFRYDNTFIFVTGIFRELSLPLQKELVVYFKENFDLNFNIISHGLENYYLSKSMDNDYNNKKILVINMGGKTTELLTYANNKLDRSDNLLLGVTDILNKFPNINEENAKCSIEEVTEFVKDKIKDLSLDNDYECAIFTGGEERFELLANFNLKDNTIFSDGIHKYMINYNNYLLDVNKVLYNKEYTLDKLYSLMPENKLWMDGARAGAVLPIAIFNMANIKYIVPSNLNLMNGVINDKYPKEKLSEERVIEIIKERVFAVCNDSITGHDYYHINRVLDVALYINEKENANEFKIQVIALMHDVFDHKYFKGNVKEALIKFFKDLKVYDYLKIKGLDDIIYSIENLGFSANIDSIKKLSLEGMIVQDADRVDALGALGIARTFSYSGKHDKPLYVPNKKEVKLTKESYYENGSEDAISHFYDKLLKLESLMNTKSGKKIAKKRTKFIKKYLRNFYEEWGNE